MGVWPGAHKRRTPCNFVSMPVDAECSVSNGPPPSTTSLLSLQTNVLEHILLRLHLTDLARCCQVCKGLRSIVQHDDIWQLMCTNRFPSLTCTELKQWLRVKAFPISAKHPAQLINNSAACAGLGDSTSTYRGLYRVLKHLEPLIGVWRCDSGSTKPALYIFSWGPGHTASRKLSYDVPGQEPFVDPFYQLGPGHSTTVQHVDDSHCLLTVQTENSRSPVTKAVQAATAVAVGGIAIPKREQTEDILGTSPEGSFEFEIQRFMQGHMAVKGPKRRRSGRRSSTGLLPVVYAMTRVERPSPTARHPLAGLWRSTGMLHTSIMSVRYDFTGAAARIVANEVVDQTSELRRWTVQAAPAAKPWAPFVEQLLSKQAEYSMLNGDFDHFQEDTAELLPEKEVMQIFKGSADIRGGIVEAVHPGYLWLYADGTIGFMTDSWAQDELLVNMKRIDEDLQLQ